MPANEPIDPRVRLAISQWPKDDPRGAVSTLCAEHGISRKSFYELRQRAQAEGPAAVLEPKSWNQGGPTDLDNGLPLCGYHHRRAHDTRFDLRQRPDGDWTFHRRT